MIKSPKKTLVYFISGKGSSHEIAEVRALSQLFNRIILFSPTLEGKEFYNLDNVEFVCTKGSLLKKKSFIEAIKLLPIWLKDLIRGLNKPSYWIKGKSRFYQLLMGKQVAQDVAIKLYSLGLLKNHNVIFGSYWFNEATVTLAFLKRSGLIESFFTRAHGRDLYEEREPGTGILPFRKFVLKYVHTVYCISQNGVEYSKNKYPKYSIKFKHAYLGTNLPYDSCLGANSNSFTILSCANYRNIKRLYLIPEFLKSYNKPIKWILIGSLKKTDPTYKRFESALEDLKSNENFTVELLGEMTNNAVHEFYASHKIDLFISLSETEGLPVSFMEAQSYGIPILTTNVGGCSEIVNETTGFLVSKNVTKSQFLHKINILKENPNIFDSPAIKKYWKDNFYSIRNYEKFYQSIIK